MLDILDVVTILIQSKAQDVLGQLINQLVDVFLFEVAHGFDAHSIHDLNTDMLKLFKVTILGLRLKDVLLDLRVFEVEDLV